MQDEEAKAGVNKQDQNGEQGPRQPFETRLPHVEGPEPAVALELPDCLSELIKTDVLLENLRVFICKHIFLPSIIILDDKFDPA